MASRKCKKSPRVLKNGRNKYARYVRILHWEMSQPAWLEMSVYGRALIIELRGRFNGGNNGEVFMSVREAAKVLNCCRDRAQKAFREIEDKGWVRLNQKGSFDWKGGPATTWILTNENHGEEIATKDFRTWTPKPEIQNPIRRDRTVGTTRQDSD